MFNFMGGNYDNSSEDLKPWESLTIFLSGYFDYIVFLGTQSFKKNLDHEIEF
jgi:hypothetical protein